MNTAPLKKFAQSARRYLREQVSNQLEQILCIDNAENRSNPAVKELLKEIEQSSKDQVIEKVAYLWFNRFCALRFMDANDYNSTLIVSPTEGMTLPEILQEAKQGNIDEELQVDASDIMSLMNESKQDEAYRLLFVAACNQLSHQMPFMFEKISDYTELLLPKDLLSENSILSETREALTNEVCQDVEVIGWLYQFYISEKKDEVFDGLKKNKKITPENIPAATQLFTPNWIVRYLVENSLGRLWMLNKPNSRLIDQMEYYIKPEQEETDFLKVTSPEELKVCDPACGSGHMLVYAFELLYAIYEEEGYDAPEIPGLILTNNLFGLELDERAGELAAFALTMKAREKYRRFFRKAVQPNICVLEKVEIPTADMDAYMEEVGHDIFSVSLEETICQFKNADNFGSLIRPIKTDVTGVRKLLEEKGVAEDAFLAQTHKAVLKVLRMVEYLCQRYQVVIANPPYMNNGGMNNELKTFLSISYKDSKNDLMTAFMERAIDLIEEQGVFGMINLPSWMFLGSFEKMRRRFIENYTFSSLVHLGRGVFGSDFGSVAFVILKDKPKRKGIYRRLFEKFVTVESNDKKQKRFLDKEKGLFYADQCSFLHIPGAPIAYWLSDDIKRLFNHKLLGDNFQSGGRCKTHKDEKYLRFWWECSLHDILSDKWRFYNKGGEARKWFGNLDYVINWTDEAKRFYSEHGGLSNPKYWGKLGVTWTGVTAGLTTYRLKVKWAEYASAAPTIISDDITNAHTLLGYLNSQLSKYLMDVINPTVQVNVGDALKLPLPKNNANVSNIVDDLINISFQDWLIEETSLLFPSHELINNKNQIVDFQSGASIEELLADINSSSINLSTRKVEHAINKQFDLARKTNKLALEKEISLNESINHSFSLQDDVGLVASDEIFLFSSEYLKEMSGTQKIIKKFISFSVGCMFGRYSLDKPGLLLANAGETLEDYLKQVPQPTFEPDDDNVIPLMDVDWFGDDIAERFKTFLKVTFGEANYEENLRFVEDALGYKTTGKGKRQSIRDYFLKDFYTDHWKRYKKRPIYWMFSSPKGTFNALIYMHRYRPDTVSTLLNEYLREFSQKLTAHRDNKKQEVLTAEGKLKIALEKEIATLGKQIEELADYERDLFELASKPPEELAIDLDDGVKVNYPKFGDVLKKIPGLS